MPTVADLTLRLDQNNPALVATHWAEATFVPVNGLNEVGIPFIDLGISPADIDAEWFIAEVVRQGSPSSVETVSEDKTPGPGRAPDSPALSSDKRSWFLNIGQTGGDAITLTVGIIKTDQR